MATKKKSATRRIAADVFRAAAVDLAGRALVGLLLLIAGAFAWLVYTGGSIPAWVALLVLVGIAVAGALGARELSADNASLVSDVDALGAELRRHKEYSRHLQNSLDALQRVISGDVDAEIPYYLEQAVLAPARSILTEQEVESVRLSVLLPDGNDASRWTMAWAAGHSMVGQLKYNERIADTLAKHAFETGEPQYWPNAESQTDFRQNPLASAPTRAMISLPIRQGDEILGVFNVVSAESDAFDEAERTFTAALAGVIAVAVSVWRESQGDPDRSNRGESYSASESKEKQWEPPHQ